MLEWFRSKKPVGSRGDVLPEPNEGLPDSHRPQGLCPRCGKQSGFSSLGSMPVTFDYGSYVQERDGSVTHQETDRVTVLRCLNCQHGVVVVEEQWVGEKPRREQMAGGVISWRGLHWWPLPETTLSSDTPTTIASAFGEAATCLAAGAPRACAVMAGRTLEAITADKGETDGTLAHRLRRLREKSTLPPTLADWADEVRVVRNFGAHWDPIQDVSREDAEQLMQFTRELIRHLYELPAELERRRGRRSTGTQPP